LADIPAIIGVVGGAAGILGGTGGLIGLWRTLRQEHREERQAFFASYEKSIATLERQVDRETDPAKKEQKRQRLEAAENEYLEQQEAYRQNRALQQSAPRGAMTADRPRAPEAVATKVRELWQEARHLSPALLSAEGHFLRGNALYTAQDFENALQEYNAALELKPDDPVTLFNRAHTLYNLHRYEEALADCNGALKLRPDDPAVLNGRGIALGHLGRYEEALADYNRALEVQPGDPHTPYNRACLFSLMQRWSEALVDLAAAIKIDAKYRQMARHDEDFESLRHDPEWGPKFWEIVGTEDKP
jgi:tetratricopeptide (TPR) repeat protein